MVLNEKQVYDSEEIMKLLKLDSLATVQKLIRNGKLKAVKIGNRYRVLGQEIFRFLGLDLTPEKPPEFSGSIIIKNGATIEFTKASKQGDISVSARTELLPNGWLRLKDAAGEWVYFPPQQIQTISE